MTEPVTYISCFVHLGKSQKNHQYFLMAVTIHIKIHIKSLKYRQNNVYILQTLLQKNVCALYLVAWAFKNKTKPPYCLSSKAVFVRAFEAFMPICTGTEFLTLGLPEQLLSPTGQLQDTLSSFPDLREWQLKQINHKLDLMM